MSGKGSFDGIDRQNAERRSGEADPPRELAELAALTRPYSNEDVKHDPMDANGQRVPLKPDVYSGRA